MNLIPATRQELETCKGIVYGISNKITGKWYLGQTIHKFCSRYPNSRFWKYPTNPYIKRAYKKYGIFAFQVYLLHKEIRNANKLDKLEKLSIKKFNCIFPNGYNFESGGQKYGKRVNKASVKRMIETHLKNKAKRRVLYDINEKKHVFYNISTFSKEHGLDSRTVSMLLSDRVKRYFGWHKFGVNLEKPFKHSKKYQIIDPNGVKQTFYNVCKFSRKNGLLVSCLCKVLSGGQICHKGFHMENPRAKKPRNWVGNPNNKKRKYSKIILEKNGSKYVILDDILQFCKTHKIDKRGIYTLMNGEQKSHRGFKLVSFKYCDKYLERNPHLRILS